MLVAAVAATLFIQPATALQGGQDIVKAMSEFFASEHEQDVIAEYTVDPMDFGAMDPLGDFEFSTGEAPGLPGMGDLDITGGRTFHFNPGPDFFNTEANGGFFCESDPANPPIPGVSTVCLDGHSDPEMYSDGAIVSVIDVAEPFGFFNLSLSCEWVVWYRLPSDPDTFSAFPQFPLDPADGTNAAVGLRTSQAQTGPFRLGFPGPGFAPEPTYSMVALGGNQIAFFTPMTEIGMPTAARYYTFCTEGTFQASDSVADSTELVETTELVHLELVTPTTTTTAAPTTTTTAAASTTEAPTTTQAASTPSTPSTTAAPQDEGESGSSSVLWIAIIIIGIILMILGWLFWWRPRESESAPPPIGLTPPPQQPAHQCDWALYFDDGGNRVQLREPNGTECCVYDVSVATSVVFHQEVARGRQDAVSPHGVEASPDERLRIPDVAFGTSPVDIWGWADVRSGPAGRQDWMQGHGDPRQLARSDIDHSADKQLIQEKPHEEAPDVSAVVIHWEHMQIKAWLTPGCPEYENTYTNDGKTEAFVQAGHECTNSEPGPECPIEFTAAGWGGAHVTGDLKYSTENVAASDVDELEPTAAALREHMGHTGPMTQTDSHDHATRAREVSETTESGGGNSVVKQDAVDINVQSLVVTESGIIVPVATWGTTERVSATMYSDLTSSIDVDGAMTRYNCETTNCAGKGPCMCAPAFTLNVVQNQGKLVVDGTSYPIHRDDVTGSWQLG